MDPPTPTSNIEPNCYFSHSLTSTLESVAYLAIENLGGRKTPEPTLVRESYAFK